MDHNHPLLVFFRYLAFNRLLFLLSFFPPSKTILDTTHGIATKTASKNNWFTNRANSTPFLLGRKYFNLELFTFAKHHKRKEKKDRIVNWAKGDQPQDLKIRFIL